MPISIEYTNDGIGIVLRHEGVVTSEELYDSVSQVYHDKRYPKLRYWIGDRTNCINYLPDADCLRKIIDLNNKKSSKNPGLLLALVSPKDLEFGMSRIFQALSGKSVFRAEVFRDRNSAEEWIRKELDSD